MIIYETVWLVALGWTLALVVHECGHVGGALAAGMAPRVLLLGIGPVVARFRRGTFTLVLRAAPLTGYVLIEPSGRARAYGASVAAGPLANLVALAACLWAASVWPDADTPPALAIAQGAFAAATLFPSRGNIAGLTGSSDGLQIYRLLRARRVPSLEAQFAAVAAPVLPVGEATGEPGIPTRHTATLLFALSRADQFSDPWARREAFSSLRALLDEADLTHAERAVVLQSLCAYHFLYDEGLARAEEADAWSQNLLALSAEPTARDTRGTVLLLAGRRDEAEALIRSALDSYRERGAAESVGAVLCRALLAKAVGAAGRADEARVLWREVDAAPAVAGLPVLCKLVTRIKARALPPQPTPTPATAGYGPEPRSPPHAASA